MTVPEKMSFACRWPDWKAVVTCELNPTVWAPATTAQIATAENANNAAVTVILRDRFIASASCVWSRYEVGTLQRLHTPASGHETCVEKGVGGHARPRRRCSLLEG